MTTERQPIHVTGTWTSEDGTEVHVEGDVMPDHPAYPGLSDPGPVSMRLADDGRPMDQLQRLGILSAADRAVLRRLSGELTMAEWMAQPEPQRLAHPWQPDKRTRLVMAARVRGVENAQTVARLCPAAFISPVRQ